MVTNDPYMLRAIEYLSCIGFLAVFALFWRYLNAEPAPAGAPAWAGQFADWFKLPDGVYFHPGHAWARLEESGVMTVGVDDFAQHLVGRLGGVELPVPGQAVNAGRTAWALKADGKAVDVLAPVSGTVLAVNAAAVAHPEVVNDDPYGRGWLFTVQVPRTASAVKSLLSGDAARRWIDEASQQLIHTMTPELGQLCQDGGLPVHGVARAIDEAHWDDVARRFLQVG